jgi:hypothetical protein
MRDFFCALGSTAHSVCDSAPSMNTLRLLPWLALLALSASACTLASENDVATAGESADELRAGADVWVRLDSSTGLRNARITAVNGAKLRCSNGQSAATCTAATLTLPSDCKWECQDNLLGLQGETLLLGKFVGSKFVVSAGFDSAQRGLGNHSIYLMRAPSTCLQDPCPASVTRQKLNASQAADVVASINFATAADINFASDTARGYDRTSAGPGLPVSGRMQNGVFNVDRVWRLETPMSACDPQLVARASAYRGDAANLIEYRTVREAESAPNVQDSARAWMVRSAETPQTVTFTTGINDLWAQKFTVAKSTCAVVIIAEH